MFCLVGEFWKSSPAVTWCLEDDWWLLSKTLPTFGEVLEPCTFLVSGADLVRCNGCILSDLSILTIIDPRIKSTTQVSFLDTLVRLSIEHSCFGLLCVELYHSASQFSAPGFEEQRCSVYQSYPW